jgi:hypothetical protein
MQLPPVILDDLAWSDMVAQARRRIAATSGGKWTLHAPVDPGITLLELFAWLLEQRVYWLDQIPDPMVRALLALLGEAPRPPSVAGTVLAIPPDAAVNLVADSPLAFRLLRSRPQLIFSTVEPFAVPPLMGTRLRVGGRDRTPDLAQGRPVRLMPADGSAAEVEIVLQLATPMAAAPHPFGILFDLDAPPSVAPEWSPFAIEGVAPPAQLQWLYPSTSAGNALVPFPDGAVVDGTAGLRRGGVVRLPLLADWHTASVGAPYLYSLRLRTDRADFASPPLVRSLVAGAAIARHQRQVKATPTIDWLPLPGNTIVLDAADTPPLPDSVVVKLLEADGQTHPWAPVADLARSGPTDRVFVVDREAGVLHFGDGLTGRVPRLAGPIVAEIDYSVGGGVAGNLGAGLSFGGTTPSFAGAVNLVAAVGGVEAESTAEAEARTTAEQLAPTRAVTAADHETLALTTPGVALARAHAAVGFLGSYPCVPVAGATTVFIVPDVPRGPAANAMAAGDEIFVAAPRPDPGALTTVATRLDQRRLVTHEVCVAPPRYRRARLAVAVTADAADPSSVRARVAGALATFCDPLTGGDDGTGWPFGEPLSPSVLLRIAAAALGDAGTVDRVAIGLDGATPTESCLDVPIGAHALVDLEEVAVVVSRAVAGREALR